MVRVIYISVLILICAVFDIKCIETGLEWITTFVRSNLKSLACVGLVFGCVAATPIPRAVKSMLSFGAIFAANCIATGGLGWIITFITSDFGCIGMACVGLVLSACVAATQVPGAVKFVVLFMAIWNANGVCIYKFLHAYWREGIQAYLDNRLERENAQPLSADLFILGCALLFSAFAGKI